MPLNMTVVPTLPTNLPRRGRPSVLHEIIRRATKHFPAWVEVESDTEGELQLLYRNCIQYRCRNKGDIVIEIKKTPAALYLQVDPATVSPALKERVIDAYNPASAVSRAIVESSPFAREPV